MKKTYSVGVIGAGNMGSGIAQKMAQEGLNVTLVDMNDAAVERGIGIITKMLNQGVERNVFTKEQVEETLSRIKGTSSYEDLKDADLVVEAVFEDKKIKGDLFEKLDQICEPKTIFATNTSSFYVHELAARTKRPDRIVGMHYFFHPAKNRLLEVIPHEGTSQETAEKASLIGKLHGKTTILVKDSPGFAVNRFFIPWYISGIRCVEDGIADYATVEYAAKEAFKVGMGPFELMNVTGVPIAEHAAQTLGDEIGAFYMPPKLLRDQVKSGQLWPFEGEVDHSKVQAVQEFMYGAALGVACQLVDEGVCSLEDLDRGAKIGLRWQAGPYEMINSIGSKKVYEYVLALNEKYPDFAVSKSLKEHAEANTSYVFNFVDLNIKEDIAYITVNRPEAMNALNETVVGQLEEKFNIAEANKDVKAVVIDAAGKSFIAGADIKFFVDNIKSNTIDKNVTFTEAGHKLLRRFETSEKKTIAIVDGLSLGGGSELALACQAIVATSAGSFGFPETGIAIYPGLGGMLRTEKHIGKELAKYFVFTGKKITAQDAYELGMVTKLVEPSEINKAVKELVAEGKTDKYADRKIPSSYDDIKKIFSDENIEALIAGAPISGVDAALAEKMSKIISKKAPLAIKVSNELIDAQSKVSIDEGIKLELGRLVEMFSSQDALKALSAKPGTQVEFEGK
jgi:enoyl-CoA hydratase/3-hydroxyacyl-CoA dehydrogenase